MNEIQKVNKQLPKLKIWNGKRVVTLDDVDRVHQRPKGTAKKNFQNNRKYFILNQDYFELTRKELWENFSPKSEPLRGNPKLKTFLFTETGYLMLSKSFTDDLAWEVQRRLVNNYFQIQPQQIQPALPQQETYLLKNTIGYICALFSNMIYYISNKQERGAIYGNGYKNKNVAC